MSYYGKKSNGLLNWMDLKSPKYRIVYWAMFAFLFLLTLVCVVPMIWSMLSGFKSTSEMLEVPQKFFPREIKLSKAINAWKVVNMSKGLLNTFIIIIGVIVFDIGINGLTGFALSKVRPAGYKIVDKLVFWSLMLPGMS
ncbi:MAG: carbohydrate ABC transporter permease, partial [Firmicutes bacterium]|nr:carbohydrate ABC transporter permease [Bacillota bacterium]